MNKLSRTLVGVGVGAVVLATVALGAVPALAHTGSLFTVLSPEVGDITVATISATDATTTALPTVLGVDASGVEIYNETGYVLTYVEEEEEEGDLYSIGTWDHNTGALLGSVPLTAGAGAFIDDIYALDTTTDGTLLAIADLEVDNGEILLQIDAVVSIDPTTGAVTIVVDVTDAAGYLDSISTDPTTGVTYLWVDEDDGLPQYIVLDLAAGTYGPTIDLLQVQTDLGGGYLRGADFDTSGTLWFFYGSELASLTGGPSETVGAVSSGVHEGDISDINLAYDPYVEPAKPELAATGTSVAGIAAGALALLGVGAVVLFASRRRSA